MSRTRNDLVKAVSQLGVTESRASRAVEVFFEALQHGLAKGDKVVLTGFGSWEWKTRLARQARNPRTGATLMLPVRKVLVFKPSRHLKDQVNPRTVGS